jgi:drug/metabolite transporter (DMT)-like permease
MTRAAISPAAFLSLLLLATLFGGNHIAARVAFDAGLDVSTAVAARSLATAAVVGLLLLWARPQLQIAPRQWRVLALLGALLTVQSLALYAAVARIPVGLALLAFNLYPLCAALWVAVLYRLRPERAVLLAMPLIFIGLALALDVFGAVGGLGAAARWREIGAGVGFAVGAALAFGLVLALTQHEVAAIDGRFRSALTMAMVGAVAVVLVAAQGGPRWPEGSAGWWGLVALCVLYGTAFTALFVLLPRLGVVGNSPILNVEPVAALGMAWLILDQRVAPVQVAGSLLVVGTVIALGLRRR